MPLPIVHIVVVGGAVACILDKICEASSGVIVVVCVVTFVDDGVAVAIALARIFEASDGEMVWV